MQNLNIPNANFGIVRDLLTDYQVKMLMQELEALKWQQFRNMPRTNAAFGKGYTYSGVTHPTTKMPTFLKDLSILCSDAVEFPINYWDSVLLNKYANGKDSIGFHSDDEPELGYNPRVMAVSLGAERTFTLIDKATKQEHKEKSKSTKKPKVPQDTIERKKKSKSTKKPKVPQDTIDRINCIADNIRVLRNRTIKIPKKHSNKKRNKISV